MTIKQKNYWLETVTMPAAQSARDLPDSIDVAVVGAGFLRTLCRAHARETRRERRRARSRNIWLGRQFAEWRHGSYRYEVAGAYAHQALR